MISCGNQVSTLLTATGFVFNPISWSWSLSDRDLSVNYVTASVKR